MAEQKEPASENFNELVKVAIVSGDNRVQVAGTGFGPKNVPHLVSVHGQTFNLELAPHLAVFRYADQPGMIGRVGIDLRRARREHRARPPSAQRAAMAQRPSWPSPPTLRCRRR